LDLPAWQEYYRNQAEFPKKAQSGSPPEDVLLALNRFDEPYTKLRAACALPQARFPIHYDDTGFQAQHYSLLLGLTNIADVRACAELALQRGADAFDEALIGIRLCDSIKNEPFLISLLFRFSLGNAMMQPLWEGLVRHQWSEGQLADFEAKLASINFPANYQLALRGEKLLFFFPSIDNLQKQPAKFAAELFGAIGAPPDSAKVQILSTLLRAMPSGWCDWNKVAAGRCFDEMISCAEPNSRRILLERAGQAEADAEKNFGGPFSPYSSFARITSRVLYPIPTLTATAQTKINLARVAIALERHRLRHGDYPESLAGLDPECQPNGIPTDVVTGRPPVYAPIGDGTFTLEYIGWKETNDGADAAWKNLARKHLVHKKAEWAWPRLAHEEH
jgi:hypothetical protein